MNVTQRQSTVTQLAAAALVPTVLGATTWHLTTPPRWAPPPTPHTYYAAPNGLSRGDGSREHPWDLGTALHGAAGRIQPGDTLWIRGGRYVGAFESTLTGTPDAPIIVRQYPGERATLDYPQTTPGHSPRFRRTFVGEAQPVLRVSGQWAWYWGFEITNSNPERHVARANGVFPTRPNNKFINLVVHDNAVGISFSNPSRNSEIYGCIIYNNGYNDIDRTHGHGIYAKNDGTFQKLVRDNVVFNQFRNGIQIYTDAGTGQLKNFLVEGNVWFNNGTLTSTHSAGVNILAGGKELADQITIADNMTYFSPGLSVRNVRVGYTNNLRNGSVTLRNNYFVGGGQILLMSFWTHATVSANVFIGDGDMVAIQDPAPSEQTWNDNLYYRDSSATAWLVANRRFSFSAFQHATGLGANDRAEVGSPSITRVFVRPNIYEHGRANIIVYNWGHQSKVPVDVSGVLRNGDRFEVHNVQNFYGTPVLSGAYTGGSILLPMHGVEPPQPVGGALNTAPRTGPDFDTFVLTATDRSR